MDTMQAIRARKSYRGDFKPDPVPREDLKEIVEAGFLAPSGCNMQTTKFIGVDEPELVKKLAEIYGIKWAQSAPAAENILLAIEAKGYATTWLEGQIQGQRRRKWVRC